VPVAETHATRDFAQVQRQTRGHADMHTLDSHFSGIRPWNLGTLGKVAPLPNGLVTTSISWRPRPMGNADAETGEEEK